MFSSYSYTPILILRITGSLGEIGVHHGKLFILLYLMLSCGEKAFAVDVFDQQHLNVDGSGHGNLTTFRKNIENIAGTMEFVEIFRSSSTDLKWDNIEERIGNKLQVGISSGPRVYFFLQNKRSKQAA